MTQLRKRRQIHRVGQEQKPLLPANIGSHGRSLVDTVMPSEVYNTRLLPEWGVLDYTHISR